MKSLKINVDIYKVISYKEKIRMIYNKNFLFWKKYATMKQYRWKYPPSTRRRKGDRYGTEEKHKKTPERSAGRTGAADPAGRDGL